MKLEITLPERPGFLHAVPLFNLFALLLLLFVLGPSLMLQSGVTVELPPSRFQMERYEEAIVVTLGQGEPEPRLYLGRDAVTVEELSARLDELKEKGVTTKSIVLLQTDKDTSVGMERQVTELVISKGFRVGMVGKSASLEGKDHGGQSE